MKEIFFHHQAQFTRSFKKKLNEELAAVGLFHSQWLVIYCIKQQQSVTLVEVSNYLDVEKPTISRTVKRLEEQGLIEDVPSEDKRERRIRLSLKGQESYDIARKIVSSFEAKLMADISEADLAATLNTIQKLKEKMQEGGI